MPGKSRTRKQAQPVMSSLLRALTFNWAAHNPVTQTILLQCYTGLDAFRRGWGSHELFKTLRRQLLIAEALCRLGYHAGEVLLIQEAHAAMMHVDAANQEKGVWLMGDVDYACLCQAFELIGRQLSVASLDSLAKARTKMVEGLLNVEQRIDIGEAST